MSKTTDNTILFVDNLTLDFPNNPKILNRVSLSLKKGEILGLVGESGSGKSVFARTLVRLESPGKIVSGIINLKGMELTKKNSKEMRRIRSKSITLAMQDPRAAMDPLFRMGSQFKEAILCASGWRKKRRSVFAKIYEMLTGIGISDPEERCRQYPHEWSRGMLQRGQLAMLFSTPSEVLILDEVTSALDPTLCLQILHLIPPFAKDRGIIFITHNILIVKEICHSMAVMKKGQIVESGRVKDILEAPAHPYTRKLLSCIREEPAP